MRTCFGGINKLMLNRFGCPKRVSSLLPHFRPFTLNLLPPSTMPRKAATSTESGEPPEPRRSSRIKDKEIGLPKTTQKTKPRARKTNKVPTDNEGNSKGPRGKKRKVEEEANGTQEEAPAEKKVRFFSLIPEPPFLRHFVCDLTGEACIPGRGSRFRPSISTCCPYGGLKASL